MYMWLILYKILFKIAAIITFEIEMGLQLFYSFENKYNRTKCIIASEWLN